MADATSGKRGMSIGLCLWYVSRRLASIAISAPSVENQSSLFGNPADQADRDPSVTELLQDATEGGLVRDDAGQYGLVVFYSYVKPLKPLAPALVEDGVHPDLVAGRPLSPFHLSLTPILDTVTGFSSTCVISVNL